jgi:hypothetical protein
MGERCSASIFARSSSTWISRSAPPRTSTDATPSTCSSAGLSTSRAIFAVSGSDLPPPESVYVRIGAAPTSNRLTVGSLTSCGSLKRACPTRSRTCVAASCRSTPSLKMTMVVDRPSRENVRTRSMPFSETSWSSSGLETSVSTSPGDAPG